MPLPRLPLTRCQICLVLKVVSMSPLLRKQLINESRVHPVNLLRCPVVISCKHDIDIEPSTRCLALTPVDRQPAVA